MIRLLSLLGILTGLLLSGTPAPTSLGAREPSAWSLCGVANHLVPKCYSKRLKPVVRVYLAQYGDGSSKADLVRIGDLLRERFESATGGALQLQITGTSVIPFKKRKRDLAPLRNRFPGPPEMMTDQRLDRLWYYYHPEVSLPLEIHGEAMRLGLGPILNRSDALLVLSAAQFEALGYASGALAITEQPSEIAWAGADGGKTEIQSDYRIVDELIHELGHVLGLDHTSAQCHSRPLDSPEALEWNRACCAESPSRDDVMSYCRGRDRADADFFHGFKECSQKFLIEEVRPTLLKGGARKRQTVDCS